ncbi:MAG TPA: OmpA family protein [Verrucomicrobiota bacterium]|nr:OmpA family protein [Verrucomicrobiota bacterium]
MNRPLFVRALTLALVIGTVFATSACRRKSQRPITPLADGGTSTVRTPPGVGAGGVTPGGRVEDPFGAGTGVGAGADGSWGLPGGRLDRSAFNEDRATLAAQTLYFDFDSSVIRMSEQTKVEAIAAFLAGAPGTALEIEGHCDERGTEEYNRALGERRALSIREALIARGVNPERLFTISYGEDRPAVDGSNEAAWARNRRGEFVVLTAR